MQEMFCGTYWGGYLEDRSWGALDIQLHREIAAVISGPPKWEAVELVCQTDLWVKADRPED